MLYIIHYRHGKNPNCWKVFDFNGSPDDARKKAFRHCSVMGYSSPFVSPLLSDLESDEVNHLERRALVNSGINNNGN